MDLSLGFLFCSIDLYFCLCASTIRLDDCGFVVEPEVRQVDSSSSILLSQDCFGYLRFFVFPYKIFIKKIFLAACGLSLVADSGVTLVAVHGLLIAVASLVAEHGL